MAGPAAFAGCAWRAIADFESPGKNRLTTVGAANKVVAIDLDISPRTVEVYRANAMLKIQAETLFDLVTMMTIATIA